MSNNNIFGLPPVTQGKKRSAWKGIFYAAFWVSGIVVGNLVLWIFSLSRLVVTLTDPELEATFVPWSGPVWFRVFVFVLLAWSPWILFSLARLWYKYAHNKEEVLASRDLVGRAWDIVNAKQEEVLGAVRGIVTVDQGDNLGPTFGREDLEEILQSRSRFEKGAQKRKDQAK